MALKNYRINIRITEDIESMLAQLTEKEFRDPVTGITRTLTRSEVVNEAIRSYFSVIANEDLQTSFLKQMNLNMENLLNDFQKSFDVILSSKINPMQNLIKDYGISSLLFLKFLTNAVNNLDELDEEEIAKMLDTANALTRVINKKKQEY